MRSRSFRAHVALAATLALAATGCTKSSPASARPVPSQRGAPVGPSRSLVVDSTVVPVSSTAPGSVGAVAYRLGPEETRFQAPITLQFLVTDAALDLNAL